MPQVNQDLQFHFGAAYFENSSLNIHTQFFFVKNNNNNNNNKF